MPHVRRSRNYRHINLQNNLTKMNGDDMLALYVSKQRDSPIINKLKREAMKNDLVVIRSIVKHDQNLNKAE